MTLLSELFPARAGGGGTLKSQRFESNGTFTPSPELLAKGGWVRVRLVAGGGGGAMQTSTKGYAISGGGGGGTGWFLVRVTGPVTVTVGAGGVPGSAGGRTAFGSLAEVFGGGQGVAVSAGNAALGGAGGGGEGMSAASLVVTSSAANTAYGSGGHSEGRGGVRGIEMPRGFGGGGHSGDESPSPAFRAAAGAPGYCEVWWEE